MVNKKNDVKKRLIVAYFIGVLFVFQVVAHSSVDEDNHNLPKDSMVNILEHDDYVSDGKLYQLAIERGIIPNNIDDEHVKEQLKNSSTYLWLIMNRGEKIVMVDMLKKRFKRDGVVIDNPSNYYVDQINLVLYRSIENSKFVIREGDNLSILFETIAAMEGDYDDGSGKSKVDVLKEVVGEKAFKQYIDNHPEKYEYLLMLDVGS